jgi:hypothetical protein
MPANSPIRSPKPGLLRDVDGHRLGERLDLEHAGHDRQAREVALEEPLGRGHGLDPHDPLRVRVVLDDPVDEQERPAMRDEALDLAGCCGRGPRPGMAAGGRSRRRRSRAVHMSLSRFGAQQAVGLRRAAAAARKAALPDAIEQVGRHPALEEGSCPSSARWIGDVGHDALDHELVERRPAAGDRLARSGPRR